MVDTSELSLHRCKMPRPRLASLMEILRPKLRAELSEAAQKFVAYRPPDCRDLKPIAANKQLDSKRITAFNSDGSQALQLKRPSIMPVGRKVGRRKPLVPRPF